MRVALQKHNRGQQPHRRTATKSVIVIVVAALVSALAFVTVSPAGANPTPPPNPTNQQLANAAAQKAALATQVGQLSGQLAAMQAQVDRLNGESELAEQRVALAISELSDAQDAADAARAAVDAANAKVAQAHLDFSNFVQASYMSGPTGGTAAGLLTATDPSELLQRGDYLGFAASHQLEAIANLNKSTIEQANADAASRAAVNRQKAAKLNAEQAQQAAAAKLASAKTQQTQLNATMATTQTQLNTAQANLATLNGQRAAYNAYQARQRAIAAAKAAAAARARAQALAAKRAADRLAAARRAAARASGSSSGSSSQDLGLQGSGISNAPSTGGWTAAKGRTAVARAMQYLGYMYAWAGGNRRGPTYGVCESGDAWNDCHIVGFDCSGLALYGWAPYLSMPHYALSQYSVAGSYHPSRSSLMPGDLLFWSSNGAISGIHHVAIYIGNGNVIQAPNSGEVIQITPVGQVSSGYYGATRPLT
ncbi:cell wall-associated NlpC family hydrolase [Jatrophihabitans sp. GAS493]|uniref:C40 family peptidase n=1 Tax=Jatrophihabitans sp. GAS493 TaxID=1907575 RepID=UPI000BB8E166|nr:NlpC/P60 family protein [Jatrophihabitans sp. GAS493]SOD73978.1 cell wall-associated NlpC family hydrolase [Jatrophihabitans sp. GAS493]